jgi:hypothetical protein
LQQKRIVTLRSSGAGHPEARVIPAATPSLSGGPVLATGVPESSSGNSGRPPEGFGRPRLTDEVDFGSPARRRADPARLCFVNLVSTSMVYDRTS